jgi:hypothetical protein
MCPGCGGEYSCYDWCPDARVFAQREAARKPLEDELSKLRAELAREKERSRIMWTALFVIGNPSDAITGIDTQRLAKQTLDRVGT